jgi:hypothetical protein
VRKGADGGDKEKPGAGGGVVRGNGLQQSWREKDLGVMGSQLKVAADLGHSCAVERTKGSRGGHGTGDQGIGAETEHFRQREGSCVSPP